MIYAFVKQVYNISTFQIHCFWADTCMNVFQSSSKIECHFKSWWLATYSGITGVLESSSGAGPVLVEHVLGWPPPVSGECVSVILYIAVRTVLEKAIDTDKSETRAGWLADQCGNFVRLSSSSDEVKEKLRNSSWLIEGITGSSMGVRVGSSWVKSGSKLLTSSGVFWSVITNNNSSAATF